MAKRGRPSGLKPPHKGSTILRLLWDVYTQSGMTQEELIRDARICNPPNGPRAGGPVDNPGEAFRNCYVRPHRIHIRLVDYVLEHTLQASDWNARMRAMLIERGLRSADVEAVMAHVGEAVKRKRA